MLYMKDSATGFVPAQDDLVLAEAREAAKRKLCTGADVSDLTKVKELLPGLLSGQQNETFAVGFVNPHAQLIAFEEMFHGTAVMTPVFPRQVVKRALDLNASHIFLVHNHPTGEAQPSDEDVSTTISIGKAAALFDIVLLDHLIVSGSGQIGSVIDSDKMRKKMLGKAGGLLSLLEAMGAPEDVLEAGRKIIDSKGKVHDAR